MKFRTKSKFLLSSLLAVLALLLGAAQSAAPAKAAGISVNTTTDEDGTGGDCSLREAIKAAESDSAYGGCAAGSGSDTITLAASTYTLTLGEQLPNSGNPINTTITITGNGATLQANAAANTSGYRILEVSSSGDLTLNNLTIKNGYCSNSSSCDAPGNNNTYRGYGGAVFNDSGALTIISSTFVNNKSESDGGAVFSRSGTLTVTNTTFKTNQANGSGGAIGNAGEGTVQVTDSTFTSNHALSGGALSATTNDTSVMGSSFTNNTATSKGGGMSVSGTTIVIKSTFKDNDAANGGGISGGYSGILGIANSTFTANTASSKGGAIFNQDDMFLFNSTLSSNTALSGGGVYDDNERGWNDNTEQSYVSIINSILANNTGSDCYFYYNNAPSSGTIFGMTNILVVDDVNYPCGTDHITSNPSLGTLTGSPAYFPLNSNSPAIDAGDADTCDTGLVNNVSQNNVIRPQDGDGDTVAVCDIGSFEVPSPTNCTAKPSQPTLLKPTDDAVISGTKVKFDWSDADCATSYKLIVKDTGSNMVVFSKNSTASKTRATLIPSTYQWFVKACNSFGCVKSAKFNFTKQ